MGFLHQVCYNISVSAGKLRWFGFRGIIDKLFPGFLVNRKWRRLKQNAIRYPIAPKPGFTVIADFSVPVSSAKTARDLVTALKLAGIPYQTYNLGHKSPISINKDLFTREHEFRTLRYTHIISNVIIPSSIELPLTKLIYLFASFDSGVTLPEGANAIVAMSEFNFAYFNRLKSETCGKIPILQMLYPFMVGNAPTVPWECVRKKLGIAFDDFVVFYNYAVCSNRKNPEGVAHAFSIAFENIPKAKLLFKISGELAFPDLYDSLKKLICRLNISDRVIFYNDYVSDTDIINITNAIDVYCSLHRGEGFGLGMAEAMSLGKPVVATDWGGSVEFIKDGIAFPIPYKLEPMNRNSWDEIAYPTVTHWAEPDVNAAAAVLKKLYMDPQLCRHTGDLAKAFIHEKYSVTNFRKSALAVLDGAR